MLTELGSIPSLTSNYKVQQLKIVKVTQLGQTLYFTGVDNKGVINIGMLAISQVGKKKAEWFKASLVK